MRPGYRGLVKMYRMRWRLFCAGVFVAGIGFAQQQVAPDPLAAATTNDIAGGKRIYDSQCALCHGIGGSGGRGPAFNVSKLRHGSDGAALIEFIVEGSEATGMPSFWFLGERPVFQVAAYVHSLGVTTEAVPLKGNPAHGMALYKTQGCAGCHVVAGSGSAYGPELTDIGARRNTSFLRQVLQDPGSSVPEGFAVVRATLRGGRTVTGIRLNEDSFTIQIRDASGKFYSFRKQDLTDLRKEFDQSPMPAYRGKLSDSDMDDLIAWLASLRGKS